MLFELNRIPMLISVVTGGFTLLGLTRIKVGRIDGEHMSYFDYEKPGILSLSKAGKMKLAGSKMADEIYLKARDQL